MNSYAPLLQKLPISAIFVDLNGIARIVSEPAKELGYLEGKRVDYACLQDFLSVGSLSSEVLVECHERWWQVQLKRVEDGAVVIATDVSSQILLQQALSRANKQQSTISLQALRHDAKTFLNGIDYYLMIAAEESLPTESIAKAKSCAERLGLLLESLSYFYGAGTSKKRKLVFRELVEHSLDTLRPKIDQSNASIEIKGNGTTIWGDVSRLGQAMTNLISNAIHYQPKEGGHIPSVKIGIKVDEKDSSYVVLEIEDNGIGIAPEHHSQVFEARTRLHSIEDYSGSGWGLAIVKQVVAEHDGSVGVSSGTGNGSKFWIRLPRDSEYSAGGG